MTLDRRSAAFRDDLADARLRGAVAAPRYVEGRRCRIVVPSAPLRRRPSPDAPLDTEVLMGEALACFEEEEGWAWVQLEGDGYVGYLPSDALGAVEPAPTHRVTALRSFLYPGPDIKLPPTGYLSLGAMPARLDAVGGFARLASGGFAHAGHLATLDAPEPDYVAVAERLIGTPYLWGGKTSLGLDCSGLVQLALAVAGIAAPRDSDQQEAGLGEAVAIRPDRAGLRRGDFVFWKGHVGLMQNEADLIHAKGHAMAVAVEPLGAAAARIEAVEGRRISAVRRLRRQGR